MPTSSWERFAPLTGVVFVALAVAGVLISISGSPSDFPGAVDEIVEYYTDNTTSIMVGGWLGLLSGIFLIWFGGSVRTRLRDGGQDRLGAIAFGGAIAAATVGFLIDTANVMAAMRADEDDGIAPETATALYDLGNGLVGGGLPMAIAVFVGAVALAAFRSTVLPTWLGILGAVIVLGLVLPWVAWIFTGVSFLFVLIVSIALFTTQDRASAAATPPPPAV